MFRRELEEAFAIAVGHHDGDLSTLLGQQDRGGAFDAGLVVVARGVVRVVIRASVSCH